ncbi:toll/interleukin-1 receptor domain-containing protein [Nostoc sp. LPT]|uniref:toll/interleukin-1 receptor domain-containing protein n=1 Tax=Nostoc sp. LPT TaxID=2815387 RepID=UPI001D23DD5A|nr:toll/interleukin-1 receptor domain-containing protein [Nostoc sp. LPT]MBN4003274.1 toll/interleukin-1 receptor domain-containing protein [Nostoc sp. LPT]
MTNPQFDVFLSYSSKDKPQVRAIAKQLRHRGLKPWLDEEQLFPGQSFQEAIQKVIHNVRAVAIIIGSDTFSKWQVIELQSLVKVSIDAQIPIIPVILTGASKAPDNVPPFLNQIAWVDFNQGTQEQAIDMLVWGITGQKPQPKPVNPAEHYDVLLCYQYLDQSKVKQFAGQLKVHNISFYPNQWELESDTEWRDIFTKLIGEINSLAIFFGNNGAPWEDEEVENLIWNYIEDRHTVIPVILPDTIQDPKFPPYLRKQLIVDLRDNPDERIRQLIHLISQNGKRGIEHE